MYKVVIIDDEPIIVEGLSRLLPWEQYHCRIAATACNGKEGLEVIRRERPDILFSDICMPGLDGLSMIAALKVEFPDMEISILTGFREFDYCQKAIRLGVSRFLLKPSNMSELEEALKTMTERLSKKAITGEEAAEESLAAGNFVVKNALQYIEEHYNEKITLTQVAEMTYVSQWHLSKLLNKEEGKNFSEILNCILCVMQKNFSKTRHIGSLMWQKWSDLQTWHIFPEYLRRQREFLQMNIEIRNSDR